MDNLDDLKAIWHTARTEDLPSSGEMVRLVSSFRARKLSSKWFVIVSAICLVCLIVAVLLLVHFRFTTTYLGGGLIAAAGAWLAATNIRSLKRFYRLEDCSNLAFLAFIEQTRQNQLYYYKRTMIVILLLCTAGWLLYLYEPLHDHPAWLAGSYAAFLIYIAIIWFVVRPRVFKRDTEKLNAVKDQLKSIAKN